MNKYFTVEELCASSTAKAKKIDNTPSKEVRAHLEELISVLTPIREALGKPMNITSGYRCPALNKAVGGAATSAHVVGYACDIQVKGMTTKEVANFIQGFLEGANIAWDQIIVEKSGSAEWVHFGIRNQKGEQRCQKFNITK